MLAAPVVPAVHAGFQPIASCHFQSMANILEQQGLRDAARRICPSWGFSWPNGDATLWRGDRWMAVLNDLHGLALAREDFASRAEAARFERDLHERGLPFVGEVDAFELPSDYEGREHVVHTVVVVRRDADGVVIVDSMNRPDEAVYDDARYERMRTGPCVEDHRLYWSAHGPRREPSLLDVADALRRDLDEHWEEGLDTVGAYLAWLECTGTMPDIARVGGERLYLASVFELLGELDARLGGFATGFTALSRRWYLAHSLAVQAGEAGDPARLRRLIAGLRDREAAFAVEVRAALAAAATERLSGV
jgi:hypothetical protein